jgi:hypothetical protein
MRQYEKPKIVINNTPIRTRVIPQQQSNNLICSAIARNIKLTPSRLNK